MKHTLIALFSLFAIYTNAAPSVGYKAATNIASYVSAQSVTNLVTKEFVEDLGISAEGGKVNVIHVRASNNSVVETYDKVIEMFSQTNTIYVKYFSDADNYLLFKQDVYSKFNTVQEGEEITVYNSIFSTFANIYATATTANQIADAIQIQAIPEWHQVYALVRAREFLVNNFTALKNSQVSNLVENLTENKYVQRTLKVNNKPLTSDIYLSYSDVGARSSSDESFNNLHIDNGYNRYFLLGSQFASSYLPSFYLYDWGQIEKKSGGSGQTNESLPTYIGNRITSTVPSWARSSTKPTYNVSEIENAASKQFVTDANSNTVAIVQSWENFLDGSNVVFSITNYMSGSYSVDAPKLRVKELRDGEYREVYNSASEIKVYIDDFSNRYVKVSMDSLAAAVAEQLANKADKNWGKYTSEGTEISSIGYSNTVYLTAPQTVFAGGLEYERVAVGLGSVCVLTEKGAPVYAAGDEGTFKFQSDGGTNFFGFSKTDSYTLGCKTDGISVVGNLVTLQYEVIMTGCPCVWYKADLQTATPWEQLNLPDGTAIPGASHVVSWNSGSATPRECYINCPEAKGFFKATVEVAGSSKFITNMPAELGAGIICTNTSASATVKNGVIKPTYNGSQVIWTWSEQ